MEQRLPQAAPGPLAVGVGPEEPQQSVAPLRPVARGQREEGEQSQALGLEAHLFPGETIPEQLQTTEGNQPDHAGLDVSVRWASPPGRDAGALSGVIAEVTSARTPR